MVDQDARPQRLLTPTERRKLEGYTLLDERTILRWELGKRVLPATRWTLNAAARRLNLPIPEAQMPRSL